MLEDYFRRKLRLVIFLREDKFHLSLSSYSTHSFAKPEDISFEKLAYLRADLIILENFQTGLGKDELLNILRDYTHGQGALYFLKDNNELEKLIAKDNFARAAIPHLYVKRKGSTPEEYDIGYLKRWGNTDFLKNWKIAGEQILNHMPSGVKKNTVKILDVGCLNGYIMETLRKHGVKNIYGNDISYEIAVNHCINKYHLPAITIGDFVKNNYPDKFFDMTIAMEILEHIRPEKTDKFISELKRVTANHGKILISTSEDTDIDKTHINCRKRSQWYYAFAKHGLIPSVRQTIFPGFNNFVFHQTKYKWQESMWRNICKSIYLLKKSTKRIN